MEIKIVVIISIIALIFIYWVKWGGMAPKPYRSRDCMGEKWKNEFPGIPADEIRNFLLLFAEAFAFKPKEKLKFEPQDKIIDIYNAIYPLKGADALELETLADYIEEKYCISFSELWNEKLTLGELLFYISMAQNKAPLNRDPITGALNRKTYTVRLSEAVNEASKAGFGLALLYVDIDNFKRFNNHNGHLVGDELLKRFVKLVGPLLGNKDSLFRVAGDEFAIIMPESGREESLNLSQRICDIAREKLAPPQPKHCGDEHCMGPAKISTSIGVGLYEKSLSVESLTEMAEKKMYEAKCAGRDRVAI